MGIGDEHRTRQRDSAARTNRYALVALLASSTTVLGCSRSDSANGTDTTADGSGTSSGGAPSASGAVTDDSTRHSASNARSDEGTTAQPQTAGSEGATPSAGFTSNSSETSQAGTTPAGKGGEAWWLLYAESELRGEVRLVHFRDGQLADNQLVSSAGGNVSRTDWSYGENHFYLLSDFSAGDEVHGRLVLVDITSSPPTVQHIAASDYTGEEYFSGGLLENGWVKIRRNRRPIPVSPEAGADSASDAGGSAEPPPWEFEDFLVDPSQPNDLIPYLPPDGDTSLFVDAEGRAAVHSQSEGTQTLYLGRIDTTGLDVSPVLTAQGMLDLPRWSEHAGWVSIADTIEVDGAERTTLHLLPGADIAGEPYTAEFDGGLVNWEWAPTQPVGLFEFQSSQGTTVYLLDPISRSVTPVLAPTETAATRPVWVNDDAFLFHSTMRTPAESFSYLWWTNAAPPFSPKPVNDELASFTVAGYQSFNRERSELFLSARTTEDTSHLYRAKLSPEPSALTLLTGTHQTVDVSLDGEHQQMLLAALRADAPEDQTAHVHWVDLNAPDSQTPLPIYLRASDTFCFDGTGAGMMRMSGNTLDRLSPTQWYPDFRSSVAVNLDDLFGPGFKVQELYNKDFGLCFFSF